MAEAQTIESILVADCGTVITKLLLVDRVAEPRTAFDSYRVVAQAEARTTGQFPWNDLSIGVVRAAKELEAITGRRLYSLGRIITPRHNLEGVDAFVITLSAVAPLRVVLAGLVKEMSLESGRRAAATTYTEIEAVLSREASRGSEAVRGNSSPLTHGLSVRSPQETWARTIRDLAPDVVLVVGGVDGGARRPVLELVEAVALGASMLEQELRPIVLYAGNAVLRAYVSRLLADITQLVIVDNVHPSTRTEHLGPAQSALEEIYRDTHLKYAPGAENLSAWSHLPFVPVATAFSRVVDFLWHREGNTDRGVLGVDLGAATTTMTATFGGRPYTTVYEHGVAHGIVEWATEHGLARLAQWMPEEIDEGTLLSMLYDQQLHPGSVPQTSDEQWLRLAIVREMLKATLDIARPTWNVSGSDFSPSSPPYNAAQKPSAAMPRIDPILLSGGGIVHTPRLGQALLAILDGLQPVGITTVLLDVNQAATAIGAIAGVKPLIAASALEAGTFVSLGTVISLVGQARQGDVVMRVRILYDDESALNVEAHYGEIEVWPLLVGQRATLEIWLHRRFDIGMGPGQGGRVEMLGGMAGLIVDARGRPLTLPRDPAERRRALRRWQWDAGG
jgi:hypothetical protein